jgi:DNA-binding Lrp family transcriptional regulator
VYEITGDYDISTYVKVKDTADLNNLIEALRAIPGIKNTDTRIVLKRHMDGRPTGSAGDLFETAAQEAAWARS